MSDDLVIEIENLGIGYSRKQILGGLNLQVQKGECISIAGSNGTGKTTLFKTILGLLPPFQGKISVLGHELSSEKERRWVRRQIGYVPQQTLPGKLPISVHDAVLMGRWGKGFSYGKRPGPKDIQVTIDILKWMGLISKEWNDCRYLSGGEQQKVAIARALVREATILLLDEPTTFLDQKSREELLHLMKRLKLEQGLTLVVITHESWQLPKLTDRAFQMTGGKLRQLTGQDMVSPSSLNWSRQNGII